MLDQELLGNVTEAVQVVLNTDPGEIQPSSALVKDLGAESIDFLDISCELEKAVGRELDFKEIIRATNEMKGSNGNDITVQEIVNYLKDNPTS